MNSSFLAAVLEKVSNVEVPYMDTFLNAPNTCRIWHVTNLFGAHVDILFIIRVKNFMLLSGHIIPLIMLTIKFRMVSIF
jgi:hypothetical protein